MSNITLCVNAIDRNAGFITIIAIVHKLIVDSKENYSMALTFFDSTPDYNDLPFINDYYDENKNIKVKNHEVLSITKVKSGKGYLIKTEVFMCFIFKNQKVAKQLVEAMEAYLKAKSGYKIFVVLGKKPSDWRLAADKSQPITWYGVKNAYSTSEELLASEEVNQSNPFL